MIAPGKHPCAAAHYRAHDGFHTLWGVFIIPNVATRPLTRWRKFHLWLGWRERDALASFNHRKDK